MHELVHRPFLGVLHKESHVLDLYHKPFAPNQTFKGSHYCFNILHLAYPSYRETLGLLRVFSGTILSLFSSPKSKSYSLTADKLNLESSGILRDCTQKYSCQCGFIVLVRSDNCLALSGGTWIVQSRDDIWEKWEISRLISFDLPRWQADAYPILIEWQILF